MSLTRLERERPREWLLWLAETPDAHHILVAYAGGLARAAYRVASTRCRLQEPGKTPTLPELQAAALMLTERLGTAQTLPITSLLASDCEAQGLPAPRPLAKAAATSASQPPLRRAS